MAIRLLLNERKVYVVVWDDFEACCARFAIQHSILEPPRGVDDFEITTNRRKTLLPLIYCRVTIDST